MSARFVVVEGLDGVGKSTFAAQLSVALGAVHMTTPSPTLRQLRAQVLAALRDEPLAIELFYAATVQAAASEVRHWLAAGRSVVMDRYWLSTVVYARQRTASAPLSEVEHQLLPADTTVWLHAPLPVRRSRVLARGVSAADRLTLTPEADASLLRDYAAALRRPIAGRVLSLESTVPCRHLVEQAVDFLGCPRLAGQETIVTADGREQPHAVDGVDDGERTGG